MPRLVSVLPNGPFYHPTVRAFLAGGVPEVMLHLRELGLLDLSALTVTGEPLERVLSLVGGERAAQATARAPVRTGRRRSGRRDHEPGPGAGARADQHGHLPARQPGSGGLGDQEHGDRPDAWWMRTASIARPGPARVFTRESEAIAAIKGQGDRPIRPGDVLVLIGRGPMGAGMEEIFQITSALRYLSFGKQVAVLTDARFSGVSTGACVGHVSPEALAGGPIGRVRDGDLIRIVVDRVKLEGSLDLVGAEGVEFGARGGSRVLVATAAPSRISRPTPTSPTTPDSGRPCRTSAAAPGAAASTIPMRSSPPCRPDRRAR